MHYIALQNIKTKFTKNEQNKIIMFCSSGLSKSTQGNRQQTSSIKSTFASFNFNTSNLTRYLLCVFFNEIYINQLTITKTKS